jgi:hypothetical protein
MRSRGRGVTKNLNELYPRSGRDDLETAEGSGAGGRWGRRRSPTPERAPLSGGGGRVGHRRSPSPLGSSLSGGRAGRKSHPSSMVPQSAREESDRRTGRRRG